MWSTTIVFCLEILDIIFNDDEYLNLFSGIEINECKVFQRYKLAKK